MSTQNPFFSFLTTFPGGTPLNNPDTTQSKGIEMGADGPPGNPLEITDTHNGIIKVLTPPGSVFNPSGRYLHQELNMLDGVHTFGLRTNSSSLPSHQWVLTVGVAEKLTIDSIKGLISGKEIPEGTSTSETLFTMSGKARANATCYLRIDGVRQQGLIAVDGNGDWTHNTGTQVAGLRSYSIEGNYDSGPVSTPPRTLRISQSPVTIPVGDGPIDIVAHPDGSFVYVCNSAGKSVSVIDTANQTVIKTLSVGGKPLSIAVHPNGRFLYVSIYLPSSVMVIDTLSQTVITTISVAHTSQGIAIHPNGSRVYVCGLESHTVSVIDTLSHRVIKTIGLGSAFRIAVHPDGSRIYVAQPGARQVAVIEPLNHTVIKTIDTAQQPYDIATNPDGSCVYVIDYFADTVLVIDTRSLTVIKTIGVRNPVAVTFHPDGSRAYVSSLADKLIAVFDTKSHAVIKTVSGGQGPKGIAVHPDRIRLYVCDAPSSTVLVIPAE